MRTVSHPTTPSDLRVIDTADRAELESRFPELATPLPRPDHRPSPAAGPFVVTCPACWFPDGAPVPDEVAAVQLAGEHDHNAHGGIPTAQIRPAVTR